MLDEVEQVLFGTVYSSRRSFEYNIPKSSSQHSNSCRPFSALSIAVSLLNSVHLEENVFPVSSDDPREVLGRAGFGARRRTSALF